MLSGGVAGTCYEPLCGNLSPAKHIGLDPNTGRDAVPRTVRPPTGKREHVGAVVIFTKQFDRFSGWRFTQIEVVHTLLSGYHYELNT